MARAMLSDGRMTSAQRRLVNIIKSYGDCAEYWPVVNDWVKGGNSYPLALTNINRTVDILMRAGIIHLTEDGMFQCVKEQE